MSCWVVPTIAAEYWRVSLQHVLECIERHAIPVRKENGFTFVDILPDPKPPTHRLPPEERPPTYQTIAPRPAIVAANPPIVTHHPVRVRTAGQRRRPSAAVG